MSFNPPMTTVIATSNMTRTRPDGVEEAITVEFGQPEPMPEETNLDGYYSTVRFTGLQMNERVFWVSGADSGQALVFAVCLPPAILSALPFANEIDMSELAHFGFPVMQIGERETGRTKAD